MRNVIQKDRPAREAAKQVQPDIPSGRRKLCANLHGAPRYRDAVEGGWDAAAGGVAAATRTVSPAASVSGGLLIIRSDGERPAMTSTLSPRSRPSCTLLRATLSLLSRVATCVP